MGMETGLVSLIAASATFVGTHFLMSHPLRAPIVRALGERGFQIVYSVVSAAAMVWMYLAFGSAPATVPLWPGFDDASWIAGTAIALLAMVLFAGSLSGNPALPAPGAEVAARREPRDVFRVTRHPMMWGFALWGVSHMVAAPTARTLVVALAVIVLALVGARLQDGKKKRLMGAAWTEWESRTSYWPRIGQLGAIGARSWILGIVIWLVGSWAHIQAGGIAAGIWRWL